MAKNSASEALPNTSIQRSKTSTFKPCSKILRKTTPHISAQTKLGSSNHCPLAAAVMKYAKLMQMAKIPIVLTASSAVIRRVFSGNSNGAVCAEGGASLRPVAAGISSANW